MAILAVAAMTTVAVGASRVTLHKTKTFKLASGKTKTFKVGYPDALKFKGSKYSGKVKLIAKGKKPAKLKKVKVLSKGSCMGGSSFCVKVQNNNNVGRSPVRVRVTASTKLPKGKKP
jgi:hypothetical protein